MLTLGKYKFNLDEGSPENRLYLCTDENGKKAWNVELHFAEGEYGGETVCPTLILGYIKTEKQTPAELKNESFKSNSIEECEEREDEFYIFEHEPMFKAAPHNYCRAMALPDFSSDWTNSTQAGCRPSRRICAR